MSVATAKLSYLRTSARKARFVIDTLRAKNVAQALVILGTLNKRAAQPVTKLVQSAVANAKQKDPALNEGRLWISKITADEGPMWKRFRAAAMGRAVKIRKRTCHITVELDTAAPTHRSVTPRPIIAQQAVPAPARAAASKSRPAAGAAPATTRRPAKRAAAAAA